MHLHLWCLPDGSMQVLFWGEEPEARHGCFLLVYKRIVADCSMICLFDLATLFLHLWSLSQHHSIQPLFFWTVCWILYYLLSLSLFFLFLSLFFDSLSHYVFLIFFLVHFVSFPYISHHSFSLSLTFSAASPIHSTNCSLICNVLLSLVWALTLIIHSSPGLFWSNLQSSCSTLSNQAVPRLPEMHKPK